MFQSYYTLLYYINDKSHLLFYIVILHYQYYYTLLYYINHIEDTDKPIDSPDKKLSFEWLGVSALETSKT